MKVILDTYLKQFYIHRYPPNNTFSSNNVDKIPKQIDVDVNHHRTVEFDHLNRRKNHHVDFNHHSRNNNCLNQVFN